MLIILCIFIIVSVFEIIHLIKYKNKKELTVYSVITAMTIALALYVILVPEYESFSRVMMNLFNIEGN